MRRRNLLTIAGAGMATALAGCTSSEGEPTESDDGEESQGDDGDDTSDYIDKDRLVNSGKFTYGHNLHSNTIVEIDSTSVAVELNIMVNPLADYEINAHYIPLSEIESEYIGWEVGQTSEVFRSTGKIDNFDYSEYEWGPTGPYVRFQYAVRKDNPSTPNATVTIPKEAHKDINEIPLQGGGTGDLSPEDYESNVDNTMAQYGGFPAILRFDLDTEIPKYEPFVIGFSWDDDMTHSDKSGKIVTQTQQVVRTGENTFVYPRRFEERGVPASSFESRKSWEDYDWDDVNHTEYEDSDSERKLMFTRLSNFSIYSNRYEEYEFKHSTQEDVTGPSLGRLVEEQIPHYTSSPVQNLWGFNYSVSHDYADDMYRKSREIIAEESNKHPVNALSFHEDILNENVIQDVAHRIYKECERRDASPIEQIRFITDFVSFFDHTWDLEENPQEAMRLAPDTSDPVYTMYRTYGDCKDYTVLLNAILQQDEFGFSPKVAHMSNITTFTDNSGDDVDVGHVSPAIPMQEVDMESVDEDRPLDRHPSTTVEPASVESDGEDYLYLEASSSLPLGYIPVQWSNEEITIL